MNPDAEVQRLNNTELIVYEAVATREKDGKPTHLVDIRDATGLPEDVVAGALDHLARIGHLSRQDGERYALGEHDWAP